MANEPVQVVLNVGALRAPRQTGTPNGNGKDFFAGRDAAFAAHRDEIAVAVRAIQRALAADARYNGLGYVKVTMAHDAIAKSHRPQKAVFRGRWTPHVGTEGIGEPIFAVTPNGLESVAAAIESAETAVVTKTDKRTGRAVPNPSRKRCEVSAIESVTLWTEQDRREFSAAEGAAWLSKAGTGGAYLVECFPFAAAEQDPTLSRGEQAAFQSLDSFLATDSVTARALPASAAAAAPQRFSVRALPLRLAELDATAADVENGARELSTDAGLHADMLHAIAQIPVVRAITLPPVVSGDRVAGVALGQAAPAEAITRLDGEIASKVGVIDGGVGASLQPWVAAHWGQLADADRDTSHGTFISGLLVAAGQLNPYLNDQRHGCLIFDVDVLPADPGETGMAFDAYYPGGVPDFLDEIDQAVAEYRRTHAVRVFNLSMNFRGPGNVARYGYTATRLDQIAQAHDVIFVISAGNLPANENRPEWHGKADFAVAALAADARGFLSEPGESLRNVSVSALNPPGMPAQVPFALARYSRRGPGLRGATKPDFAHVGGSGTANPDGDTGLVSLDGNGMLASGAGTSYAAPLVARRLADLDALIEGDVSREVLLALLVHFSRTPDVFTQKQIMPLTRDLIGFGVPITAEEMLQRDDSEITLVFNSLVRPREDASLTFAWPEGLVSEGGICRGDARLTVVARPIVAYEHGDERIRVNIGARLMQEQEDGGFLNRVHPVNAPRRSGDEPASERELLAEALKWQVVKCFEVKLKGRGPSSTWKFVVDYLERAEESLPTDGVEFAAVLTIADPSRTAPVFAQVRQNLSSLGIRTDDIRTSIRARTTT